MVSLCFWVSVYLLRERGLLVFLCDPICLEYVYLHITLPNSSLRGDLASSLILHSAAPSLPAVEVQAWSHKLEISVGSINPPPSPIDHQCHKSCIPGNVSGTKCNLYFSIQEGDGNSSCSLGIDSHKNKSALPLKLLKRELCTLNIKWPGRAFSYGWKDCACKFLEYVPICAKKSSHGSLGLTSKSRWCSRTVCIQNVTLSQAFALSRSMEQI